MPDGPQHADLKDPLLSVSEAAKELPPESDLNYRDLLGLVRAGVLPCTKYGRMYLIQRDDFEAFLESR